MRKLAPWIALLLLATPTTALAQYLEYVSNRLQMSANSIATAPADPVMSTVQPREEFDELPLAVVTKWPVGLAQGTLLGAFRLSMGVLDLLFAPVTPFQMLSPAPRYKLPFFEDAEHEWY